MAPSKGPLSVSDICAMHADVGLYVSNIHDAVYPKGKYIAQLRCTKVIEALAQSGDQMTASQQRALAFAGLCLSMFVRLDGSTLVPESRDEERLFLRMLSDLLSSANAAMESQLEVSRVRG